MAPNTKAVTPTTLSKKETLKDEYKVEEWEKPKVSHDDFSDDIPVISFAGIDEDYPGGRRETILKKVLWACQKLGSFQIVDHSFDVKLIEVMFKLSREFFSLSDEEKLQYEMIHGKDQDGFLISSHLQEEVVANWRELMFFITQPIQGRDYTRWPKKPEQWRVVVEAFSEKMMDLSYKLSELLSEGLGLEKDALAKSLVDINQHVAVNHYPKCQQPECVLGLKRHTDPSSFTMLLQDDVGGLQVMKDDGETWITVRPIENAFIVLIGDHFHYMSNGRLKKGEHRAIVNSGQARMSIATFMNPAQNAKVYPLNLKDNEKSLLEEPITYAEMTNKHKIKYIETMRLKKLAKEENWAQEKLDLKLTLLD